MPELEHADLIQATEHQALSPSEAKLADLEQQLQAPQHQTMEQHGTVQG